LRSTHDLSEELSLAFFSRWSSRPLVVRSSSVTAQVVSERSKSQGAKRPKLAHSLLVLAAEVGEALLSEMIPSWLHEVAKCLLKIKLHHKQHKLAASIDKINGGPTLGPYSH
jgi:hypothetical protein